MSAGGGGNDFDYETVFRSMREGFALCEVIWDAQGKLADYTILEMNPALRDMLGVGAEAIGTRLRDGGQVDARWLAVCQRAMAEGEPIGFEFHNPDTGRWHEIRLSRVDRDRMTQFFFDITARKEAEARQAELFDELNHRVKNNLAMVAGLLDLQARIAPPRVRDQLLKAVDRVHSVAAVHANLYNGRQATSVGFGDYVRNLCARLGESLFEEGRSPIEVMADDFTIPADLAIPLGMILNELVTNAAKHAYPEGAGGPIRVTVAREADHLRLEVADNGAGLPPGLANAESSPRSAGGLGMRLVRSLVRQVGGTLTANACDGARFDIRVPLAE